MPNEATRRKYELEMYQLGAAVSRACKQTGAPKDQAAQEEVKAEHGRGVAMYRIVKQICLAPPMDQRRVDELVAIVREMGVAQPT